MAELGIGVIGLGVGERHAAGFARHPAARIAALCDIDPAKREMAGERYPGARIYQDASELIADPAVQVVSIASYDDVHFEQAAAALSAGKHVFVEKPVCLQAEELAELRRLISANQGLKLSSNLILRRAPRFLDLRARMRDGTMGAVFYMEADYNYGRLHKVVDGWRGRLPFYSVVHGGAIHLVDLAMWLTGKRVVEVSAVGNAIASSGTSFRFNDLVVATLVCEGGMLVKVSANFGCVTPHFHRLMVYGTEATFENRPDCGLLWTSRDPAVAPERIDAAYPGTDKGDMIPAFVEAILTGSDPLVTCADVFDTMAVCLAIEEAAASGRRVAVTYA